MGVYFEKRVYSNENPVDAYIANDMYFMAHWHVDIELVYVCNGHIRVGINKECRVLKQGEMAICNSKDIHYYDSRDLHSTIIFIIFHPEYISNIVCWPKNFRFFTPYFDSAFFSNLDENIRENIKNIFYSIVKEKELKRNFYDLYLKGKILELCALIFRHFPTYTIDSNKEFSRLLYMEAMQDAIQYIENNYMNSITLDDLAKRVNFSPFYFSKLFKKVCGMNFKIYLNSIRSDKAESLIKSSNKAIADIAFECGFNSIRAFNRVFKSVKGFTPSSIRKSM
jgi:AraC-like DNA-binding protein